jgi:hypothetical protein
MAVSDEDGGAYEKIEKKDCRDSIEHPGDLKNGIALKAASQKRVNPGHAESFKDWQPTLKTRDSHHN